MKKNNTTTRCIQHFEYKKANTNAVLEKLAWWAEPGLIRMMKLKFGATLRMSSYSLCLNLRFQVQIVGVEFEACGDLPGREGIL